jgi:putative ABC transport system substrate-binding protein
MLDVRRREFITLLGGAAAWPLAARAQPADRMRRIGILVSAASDADAQVRIAVFQQGLHKLGWTDGRNIRSELRWGAGDTDRIQAYATELVGLKPDVIFSVGAPALAALHRATNTIPIVFTQVADPIGGGFVPSLARPGGNITGFTNHEYAMVGKWLEVLKEVAPRVAQVAVVHHPESPSSAGYLREIGNAAASFGVQLIPGGVHNAAEIERVIEAFAREPNGGLIVLSDIATNVHRELIIALAARHRLPAVYLFRYFVTAGGLMCYGADVVDLHRRSTSYIDRILKGEKPRDLPIQAPTKFELVINLKTANALGLQVPPTLLARADEVLE